MNRSVVFRIVFRIVSAFVLLVAIAGIGYFAYQAGITQGLAQNVQALSGQTPTTNLPYYAFPYGPRFIGWGGFGLFGCLIPLFLIFLAFAALRGLFWFGPHRWRFHHHGPWGMPHEPGTGDWDRGVPSMFDEWHRRSHEKPAQEPADKS